MDKIIRICFVVFVSLALTGCANNGSTIDLVCREIGYNGGIRIEKCGYNLSCEAKYKCYTFETGYRQIDYK